MEEMHVVKAGDRELIALDLDPELVSKIASQSGFACKVSENARAVIAELTAESREGPLLLFDAADSANLGWFSRCQFYVDGHTGAVLQTPMYVGNLRDPRGRPMAQSVRLQISKEIPVGVKIAGRQQVSEQDQESQFQAQHGFAGGRTGHQGQPHYQASPGPGARHRQVEG